MSIRQHASAPQPRLRLKALLVLTVLAGLLGMHGLANTGALPATSSPSHAAHHLRPARAMAAPAPAPGSASRDHGQRVCCPGHDDGADGSGGGTGHAHHADPTCASGALPGAVVLPVLPASLPDTADRTVPLAGRLADGTTGARAPPSLAQLQVLRI
ncbi:DUF6153 family protein [Streptomyces endophytica]|uniref:DUF6153 family protein n=1 Tax=Streptomyces endophytica TaxID=2991496 RepID=A0ABY6PBH2_9ACTN|nr:DUF6153 family protein [Streptomyces endophytica]UZJ30597.1 DUF6153 family protein [Streptomyces endophytica]